MFHEAVMVRGIGNGSRNRNTGAAHRELDQTRGRSTSATNLQTAHLEEGKTLSLG
jgi:hypothetical protein